MSILKKQKTSLLLLYKTTNNHALTQKNYLNNQTYQTRRKELRLAILEQILQNCFLASL